jgi:gliding motility-associated-like protein
VLQYELQVDDVRISPVVAASSLSLNLDATEDRIRWCDSTTLCIAGLPSNIPVIWSPMTGLSSLSGSCATASPCSTTTYTASFSVPATCPNSCSPTVQVDPLRITIEVESPTVEVHTLGPVICGTEQVVVASIPEGVCATGGGWRTAPGTTIQGDSLIIAELSPESTGPYFYDIVHPGGACSAVGGTVVLRPQGTVADLYVPNSFSPNDDGINDVFTGVSRGFADFQLTIYDRWGRAVFTTLDAGAGWDGSSGGQWLPSGVYAYVLESTLACSTEGDRVQGHVTLLR